MLPDKYRSFEDLKAIVAGNIPEGVALEYKSSDVLTKCQDDTLCKIVSAFANSAGGQFVIGIALKGGKLTLDGGIPSPSHYRDRIYQIVNARTSPPIESFEVFEIFDGDRVYHVVDVPVSPKAPHQFRHQYYKRRGSHSDPMEHYEIEDVRNRPKGSRVPLSVDLVTRQEILLLLRVRNDDPTESIKNATFGIDANFKWESGGARSLVDRGLKALRPGVELFYHLDSANSVLAQSDEPELVVRVGYEFGGRTTHDTFVFHVGDFKSSAVVHSDLSVTMGKLTDKVSALVNELNKLRQQNSSVLRMVDGSGLRLSHRTLEALRNQNAKYDPTEFDSAIVC